MKDPANPVPTSEKTFRLTWIPMGSPRLRPPPGLSLLEEALFWRSFWALFDHGEPQGYLLLDDLPLYLHVRDLRWWDAHSVRIVAAFESSEIAGRQVISFPPMIHALETQRRKLHKRGSGLSPPSPAPPAHDLSHSVLDSSNSTAKREREGARETRAEAPTAQGEQCASTDQKGEPDGIKELARTLAWSKRTR